MTRKAMALLRRISGAALSAGLVILLIGLYYAIVRAGIPYQDPTPEMQLRYAIDAGVGDALLRAGFILLAGGGMIRLLLKMKK